MNELNVVFEYHERTKHHFHRYAASLGYLDWATQPDPFRRYSGAKLIQLATSEVAPIPTYDDLFVPGRVAADPINRCSISKFFEHSMALSAWKQFKDSRWAMRINPSSGNLHPTEAYIVCGPVDGLADEGGVYHYAPREHALELRCAISTTTWQALSRTWPIGSFLVGLTSIHWREAWKYGERAFRYCQHDVGHGLAALAISAAVRGWRCWMVDSIDDESLVRLLGADRDDDFHAAEREEPDVLVVVETDQASHQQIAREDAGSNSFGCDVSSDAITAIAQSQWFGKANKLSADHVDWPIIDEVSRASRKGAGSSPVTIDVATSDATNQLPEFRLLGPRSISAEQIIRQRRSAVAMDGRTSITAEEFFFMLDRVMPRFDRAPWTALGPPVCVHLLLFVHLVDGLDPGLYVLVREANQIDSLRAAMAADFEWEKPPHCPAHLPLFRLRAGDTRELAAQVSCHQEIAGMGAFSCGMIARFQNMLEEHGPWFYRRLFWETGVIGQVLYLEAEAAGVRGTGIGCFFDDAVHDAAGIRSRQWQSLYHFTIGGAKDDLRLMTWPAYSHR